MNYYVYVYLDPRKPGNYNYDDYSFTHEPIYIGKGKDHRMNKHIGVCKNPKLRGKNKFYDKLNKIIKDHDPIKYKLHDKLSESDTFLLETNLVTSIGISDLSLGPLCNLTDGGEGVSRKILTDQERYDKGNGHRGKTYKEIYGIGRANEIIELKSKSLKEFNENNPDSNSGANNGMYSKKHSDSTKKIMSELASKKTRSKNPNAKKISVYDINNNFIKTFDCIVDIVEELKINRVSIGFVLNGKLKSSKGYIFKYKNKIIE